MILLTRENGITKIFAEYYSLEVPKDRPFVYVNDRSGGRAAELFVLSGVNTITACDDTTSIEPWKVDEGLDEITLALEARSTAWTKKIYRFRCGPRRFTYEIEVHGRGSLTDVHYFGGYYSGQVRWGSGFFHSGQEFVQGFNPEPDTREIYHFAPEAGAAINLTGVPLPGRSDWFFTPPPFCFAFQLASGWMGLGVEARAGENLFNEYRYLGGPGCFSLCLPYEGHTRVDGAYRLPAVGFDFGPDPYSLLAIHAQRLRDAGFAPASHPRRQPAWWSEPLFCGWGAQCHLANIVGGRAPDFSNQPSYESFLAVLEKNGVFPGTVVLDDKWQLEYGENQADPAKWPDLPGFIRQRHAQGQHVLLWLKAWDPEGIPVEECIRGAAGLPLAVDPTNPDFAHRLRLSVRRMLSPDGYDADGFKIDFTARIPSGPGIQVYGEGWGLELMRLYLSIIYDEAKRVKPDALVIAHTPHPYLADVVDAIRLNDVNTRADVCRQMAHRARVAAIACPDALIDTDNWPMPGKDAWRAYLSRRPLLGIPALYYASHIDSTGEAFTEDDYGLIRSTWAEYRQALARRCAEGADGKINELGGSFVPGPNPLVKRLALASTLAADTKPLKAWDEDRAQNS